MSTFICPKGHVSTEPDYCSECGARIGGKPGGGPAAAADAGSALPAAGVGEICPDCGTVREQSGIAFCEVCGYNFNTGAHGELGLIPPAAPPAVPQPAPDPAPAAEAVQATAQPGVPATPQTAVRWSVTLSVDPALHEEGSPEPPADVPPVTLALDKPVNLIGRSSAARGIFPEITIAHDDAVSHRHALLSVDAAGTLLLRDIGAANGTRLNGSDVKPLTDIPLHDGDTITLGHWSRLQIVAGA